MSLPARNGTHSAPPSVYRIEVACKPGISDAAGLALANQLPALGVANVADVRVCPVFEITGRLNVSQLEQVARELLADPVTQDYRIGEGPLSPGFLIGPHWRVEVWLKNSVSDPVEGSVKKGIADLGLPAPEKVRCGHAYKLLGRPQAAQVEKVARKLFSNPVIHRYKVVAP